MMSHEAWWPLLHNWFRYGVWTDCLHQHWTLSACGPVRLFGYSLPLMRVWTYCQNCHAQRRQHRLPHRRRQ